MDIKRISGNDTIPLRHLMLRQSGTFDDCRFVGDDEDQTFHLGAFEKNKLISVASFYFENNPLFDFQYQYRLRGMATLEEYQHQGLSSDLLTMAFPIIKQNFCHVVWCNARESAMGFYQKVGFEATGDIFDIEGIGPHKLMYRNLN